MAKRFYKVNEIVWIVDKKRTGKVLDMDVSKLSAVVEIVLDNGEHQAYFVPFRLMDKYRAPKTKTPKDDDVVYFAKVHPDAKLPTKRDEDGCYDIYAFSQDPKTYIIQPQEIVEIATGFASAFPAKYRFDVQRERGSTGSIGLVPRCGQIDSGYRGQWFLKMQNVSNKTIILSPFVNEVVTSGEVTIYPTSKAICQAALEIVPKVKTVEIPINELQNIPSERGMGKLGSSNK